MPAPQSAPFLAGGGACPATARSKVMTPTIFWRNLVSLPYGSGLHISPLSGRAFIVRTCLRRCFGLADYRFQRATVDSGTKRLLYKIMLSPPSVTIVLFTDMHTHTLTPYPSDSPPLPLFLVGKGTVSWECFSGCWPHPWQRWHLDTGTWSKHTQTQPTEGTVLKPPRSRRSTPPHVLRTRGMLWSLGPAPTENGSPPREAAPPATRSPTRRHLERILRSGGRKKCRLY